MTSTLQLDRLGISAGVYYECPNTKAFRIVVGALNDIVQELTFKFTSDGIFLCDYPDGNPIIVNLHINAPKLEHSYEIAGGEIFPMTFNSTQILKYISALPGDKPFVMYYDFKNEENQCLRIKSSNASSGHVGTGSITLLLLNNKEDLDILSVPCKLRVCLPASEFVNMLNNMSLIAGHRGRFDLTIHVGNESDKEDEDYVQLEAFDETSDLNSWCERFTSVVTNLTPKEKLESVEDMPIIDTSGDMSDEASYDLICRIDETRPAKRRCFEHKDSEPFNVTNSYSTNYLKSISKVAGLVQTVDLKFLQPAGTDNIIFTIEMDIPNFGLLTFILGEKEVL